MLFPKLDTSDARIKEFDLKEYSADSAYEPYTSIVLDPEDNIFKTVSGKFHDKKDAYEKLTGRGFVVRKTFESKIFDWIEEHAKNNIEAYLMFSTAFSKWQGNNILNQYYIDLLRDIPSISREKIKGDPNSKGMPLVNVRKPEHQQHESVLQESTHNLTIQPADKDGNSIGEDIDFGKVTFDTSEITNKNVISSIVSYDVLTQIKDLFDSTLQPSTNTPLGKFISYKKDPDTGEIEYRTDKYGNNVPSYEHKYEYFNILLDGKRLDTTSRKSLFDRVIAANNKHTPNKYPDQIDLDKTQSNLAKRASNLIVPLLLEINKLSTVEDKDKINDLVSTIQEYLKSASIAKYENKAYVIRSEDPYRNNLDIQQKLDAYEKAINLLNGQVLTSKWVAVTDNEGNPIKATDPAEQKTDEKGNLLKKQTKYRDQLSAKEERLRGNLLKKYCPEQYINDNDKYQVAVANIKAQRNKYIDDTVKETEEHVLKNDLTELKNELKDIYLTLQPVDQVLERKKYLTSAINKLKYRTNVLKNSRSINPLQYTPNIPSPADQAAYSATLPKTGYISTNAEKDYSKKTSGYRAALTQGLAHDKIVNKGIHRKKQETVTEDCIPEVDITAPGKYVNCGANDGNDVIDATNQSNMLSNSGTFVMSEEQTEVHNTLNPKLFELNKLKPEVRAGLLKIASVFETALNLQIKPVDIYFTGSNANYNYTENSDIDLHLVYDYEQVGMPAEVLTKYAIAKKQLFNRDYNILVKNLPVELGIENINEPIVSNAIYSLVNDNWIVTPEYTNAISTEIDTRLYNKILQKVEKCIESQDSSEIGKLWDILYNMRKISLETEGEFGKGNALFKKLRNAGIFDRLKDAYYKSASKELSVEALKEI